MGLSENMAWYLKIHTSSAEVLSFTSKPAPAPAPCMAPPSPQSLRLDTWVPFAMPPTTQLSHGHPIQSRSCKDLKMSTSSFSQTTIPAKGYAVSHVDYCNNLLPGLSASSNLHIEVRGIFLRCKTDHVVPLPKFLQGHNVLKSCL